MGSGQGCSQLRQLGGGQVRLRRTDRVAPIPHAVGAIGIVAPDDLANPIRRVACHGGRCHATSQQPKKVPMAALDRIMCAAIAVLEFVVGQVGCEVDASWHVPFYNSTTRPGISSRPSPGWRMIWVPAYSLTCACSISQKVGQRRIPGSLLPRSQASHSPSGVTISGLSR